MSDTNIKSAESYRIDIPVAENIKATPITTVILDMLEEQKEILKEIRDALTNKTGMGKATKEAMITKTSGYDRKVIYNQIEEIMSLVRDLEDDLPGGNKTLETLSEKVVYFKYLMQETAAIDKDGEYYACRYRYKDDDIIRNILKCHAGEPYWQL